MQHLCSHWVTALGTDGFLRDLLDFLRVGIFFSSFSIYLFCIYKKKILKTIGIKFIWLFSKNTVIIQLKTTLAFSKKKKFPKECSYLRITSDYSLACICELCTCAQPYSLLFLSLHGLIGVVRFLLQKHFSIEDLINV